MGLDLYHLVNQQRADVQTFTRSGGGFAHTWKKPHGCGMIYILCVGGGGGGGGGQNSGTGGGGGGGGGGSALTTLLCPAFLLPDRLYVTVGAGGLGGAINAAGATGNPSDVSLDFGATAASRLIRSSTSNSMGGGAGGTAGGAGGGAGAVATIGLMPLAGLGRYQFILGQAGTTGGANTPTGGTNLIIPVTGCLCTGGVGGGGAAAASSSPAGAISATANTLLSEYRGSGTQVWNPFFSFGGYGGDGAVGGTNPGQHGALGAGGGGGGASTTTAGVGGNGGDGVVIIIAW